MGEVKKLAKHSSIYVLANAARNVVGFLMLPIYTQYLTPADYGAIALVMFTLGVIEPIFGARLVQAIPKFYHDARDPSDRAAVISTALIVTTLVSLLSMLAVLACRDPISLGLFGTGSYGPVVALFSLALVTQAVEYYGFVHIRLLEKPWLFMWLSLAKLAVQLSLNIWFIVFQGAGVMGVAWASAISGIVFATYMGAYTISKVGVAFRPAMARGMVSFCWPLWLSGLAILYISSSSRPFIRIFSNLDEVGFYELAAKFGSIIAVLIWDPFFLIWQIERFKIGATDQARQTFRVVFRLISTALVFVGVGISVFSGAVISVMADVSFHGAVAAVAPITFGVIFHCLCNYVNFSFLAKEQTGLVTKITFMAAIVVTALNLALIPVWGFVGAAFAIMFTQIFRFFLLYHWGRSLYDMNISMGEFVIVTCVSLIFAVGAAEILIPNLIMAVFKDLATMLVYATVIVFVLLRDKETRDFVRRIRLPRGSAQV